MQQSTADDSGEASVSRRLVLTALAAGAGAVGLSDALDSQGAADGGGTLALGDRGEKRTREAWQHDGIYTAPQTVPPAASEDQLFWSYNDDLAVGEIFAPDTLPASWTATGLQWGADTTLSGARSQAGEPGVAFVFQDGTGFFEVQAPDSDTRFINSGIEIVMGSDLGAAQSLHSGHLPAVLFGLDGAGEVVVDG